jgi:hypothetical protein
MHCWNASLFGCDEIHSADLFVSDKYGVGSNGKSVVGLLKVARKIDLTVGMKFKKKGILNCVLEVISLYTPEGESQHARTRVCIAQQDLGVRVYSVSALMDKRLFVPLDGASTNTN